MPEPAFESATVDRLRVPPHSIQAEQQVLGGLMLENGAWAQIADRVSAADFIRPEHKLIFAAIARLAEIGRPFDSLLVAEELDHRGELKDASGFAYVTSLHNDCPSAANLRAYADIVREHSVIRQMIRIGQEIQDRGYRPEGRRAAELLDLMEQQAFDLAQQKARDTAGFVPAKTLLTKAVNRIELLYERDDPITGISTGFNDLDDMTSGLQPADLIVIAGRPSMGKTALAMNIAENVSIRSSLPVAVFSMEMPGEAIMLRMISSLGRIDHKRVRTGRLEDAEWARLTSAVSLLAEAPIYIDDMAALTVAEIRARSRRLVREVGGLGLIVLDYIQLMGGDADNRVLELSAITRGLKHLARELNVPVIALSQLNRNLDSRPNKRPVLSDLRESGSIEQDADVVIFIYRDEVYNEDSPDKGTAEIIIAKQRNGPIGHARLTFQGQYTKFENYIDNVYG